MTKEELKHHFTEKHEHDPIKFKVICPKENHRCEHCFEEFSSEVYLNTHIETHDNIYTCDICTEGFKKFLDYIFHNQTHSEDKKYKCILCKFQSLRKENMRSHVDIHIFNRSIYKCETCNKRFVVHKNLQDHLNTHSGEKPYICDVCGHSFSLLMCLKSHKRKVHRELFVEHQCPFCDKSFPFKSYLTTHLRVHNEEKLICDICGKQFSHPAYLKVHKNIHLGIRDFRCTYCDKSFVTKARLITHVRTHTGEKPFECRHCEKTFSQYNSRKIHERIHTNERPYVCHICNNGFMSRTILNNHLKKCKGS